MSSAFRLIAPKCVPPLEPEFRPAVLANRAFREEVAASGQGTPLIIGLARSDGAFSRYETVAFPTATRGPGEPDLCRTHRQVPALGARRLEGDHRRAAEHRRAYRPCVRTGWPAQV